MNGLSLYTSDTIWKANEVRASKLILQDTGNLVLKNDCNKAMWKTETAGECPAGLEQFTMYLMKSWHSEITNLLPNEDVTRNLTLK